MVPSMKQLVRTESMQMKEAKERQTELSHTEGTIWNMLLSADRDGIIDLVRRNESVLLERDSVEATPMLVLCLYKSPAHLAIFHELKGMPEV